VLKFQDREADDGVAAAAMLFREAGYEPIVVSGDRDLFQCVQFGARVWYLNTKEFVTKENFRETTKAIFKLDDGIGPELYTLFRALCGDASDGIKGVPGVGPKRAAEILLDADHDIDNGSQGGYSLGDDLPEQQLDYVVNSIAQLTAAAPKGVPAFKRAVVENREYLERVLQAVDLRGSFGPATTLVPALQNVPGFNRNVIRKYFLRLKFTSVLGDEHRYLDPFERAVRRRDSA
jgi:5'-3' exonuclease